MIDARERKHEDARRSPTRSPSCPVTALVGFDEQSVDEITSALRAADADIAKAVLAYERDHKARAGVIQAAEQRIDSQ